jgi:hypothetical protein
MEVGSLFRLTRTARGAPGLGIYFDGTVRWANDSNNVTREFSYTGTFTDVCALIS